MKVILDCPYEQRNQAKALGARWDPAIKKWYVVDPPDLAPFAPWLPSDVVDFVGRPVAGASKATAKPARSSASKTSQQTRRQSVPLPALPVLPPWPPSQAAEEDDGPPWD